MFCFYDLTPMLLAAVGKRGVDGGTIALLSHISTNPIDNINN